ncbi:MAG: tetratricopeptide repeat protein, partial [Flavitalea sp.]
MPKVVNQIIICSLLLCAAFSKVSAQGGLSFDLIKPKKFEEKKLASEKTDEKKFTAVRRFTQNGITKFNYNFNANLKLEMVLERAKAEYRDDYNKLLSFYNYDIKKMTPYHTELDSVIYKANMGILIHDLRNAWVDNLYMLMGKARYFKGDLDTAYLTFQYVNYAFSPKEKDGYDKPIGSNANEGGSAFSISTKEKTDLPSKVWSRPPSRNESFIWQIRTYLAKNENAEAAGLIETIKNDPLFPERLKTDLHEVQALWFYQQEIYDSAAVYLEKALPNAANNQEQARWEYLIGQLYERSDDPVLAKEFFEKAAKRTLNPVLEVYARLNATRQNRSDEKAIAENIEALLKMARKDRYVNYRDIIYFTAATMELDRKNIEGAKQLLLKATQAAKPNVEGSQRTNAFLLLGDLSYETRKYHDAKRFYDSVNVSDPAIQNTELLQERKLALVPIVEQLDILDRNDSLQRIAAMPETEREAYVKKLVKQIRKARGIKDGAGAETESAGNNSINKTDAPADLFGNTKSDWYFDNASLKSKGFTEFRNKFGNRPNVDNWRRSSAIANQQNSNNKDPKSIDFGKEGAPAASDSASVISFESLMKNLPLTEEQMKISRDSMEKATFQLGKMYFESLEDYEGTIITLEELLGKYPATIHKAEALFILHYCYTKTGNIAKANETKQALEKDFPGSEYQKIVTNPKGGSQRSNELIAITKQYDQIYNDFIEGRFAKAIEDKKAADSMYGVTYWTPQLLYIESVYYIKQKDDPKAKIVLQNIIKLYPNNEMAARAQTMLDVLGRRKEIEEYLTNLKIERPGEDSAIVI